MLLFFTLWSCSETDVSENNNSNNGNAISKNIQNDNDAGTNNKAPLQKEAPTFSGNANAATSDTPDLLKGISKKGCDNGPGGAGAVSYFYDELNIKGGVVSGSERWLMFANKQWKERKGSDCEVVWSLQGKTRTPTRCAGCTMGVTVVNNLDKGLSTPPNSTVPTTLNPCSIGVIPNPLLENITGLFKR